MPNVVVLSPVRSKNRTHVHSRTGSGCGGSERSRSAQSESINESLEEVLALGLAKSAALGTFPTEAERVVDLYEEDPPIWYPDRPPVMNERPCDHEENGTRAWKIF